MGQMWLLRRYLRQRNVESQLRTRVLRFLEYKHSTQEQLIPEARITILTLLSRNLHSELQYVVSFSNLLVHPLFAYAESVAKATMYGLGDTVLSTASCASQDVLFYRGVVTTHMYVIVSGRLGYERPGANECIARPGDWMCEASLWTNWVSQGDLHVANECQLILVDNRRFGEAVETDKM